MRKITVSDATLSVVYENELSLTFRERLSIAEKLDLVNVDGIELPLLKNGKENEVICQTLSKTIKNAMVKIPVGVSEESVNQAYQCVKDAIKPCLQVVMPVSTAQMEYFHHLKAPAMLEKIAELVKNASSLCSLVEFCAVDAFRAEEGFIESVAKTAKENGAYAITISDEAGDAFPEDFANVVNKIKAVCDIEVYVKPSDKLRLAPACALEAIKAGANGVKTSSIGEYLSLSTLADITRAKKYDIDATCDIDVTRAKTILSSIEGSVKEDETTSSTFSNNGFISADATMKEVVDTVKSLGYELSDDDNGKVYEEFKRVSAKKEDIEIKELEAIIASTAMQVPSTYHLVNYVVNSGNIIPATANVTLEKDGEKFTGVSTGDGPIDAAFHAIEQVIGHHYELDDFQVHAVTKGREAVGSSIIRLRANGKLYPGNGVSTDIVGACIRAYINALNKIVYEEEQV